MTIKEKYLAWQLEHQLHFVVRVGVDLHLHRVHILVDYAMHRLCICENPPQQCNIRVSRLSYYLRDVVSVVYATATWLSGCQSHASNVSKRLNP